MSVKQNLIDERDAIIAAAKAVNLDEEKQKAKKNNAANKQADIDTITAGYDSQIADTQAVYDKRIGDTKIAYEDEYQKNAVQKLINEKQIAEKNANLGLTDSGLNRTQQTAAQLSYANQKGKIDLARQNALDELGLSLANAITTLKNQKASDIRNVENQWDNLSDEQGVNAYNAMLGNYNDQIKSYNDGITDIEKKEQQIAYDTWKTEQDIAYDKWKAEQDYNLSVEKANIDAQTQLQKAAISASKDKSEDGTLIYNWKGETVVDGNGNTLLKFTGSDGKSYNVMAGKNPYTNSYNAKISDVIDGKCIIDKDWQNKNKNSSNAIVRSCAKYGVFSNGYQPKGVCYYDDAGDIIDAGALTSTTRKDYMNGKLQTVWYAEKTKTYWIWDGTLNEYVKYEF